MKRIESVPRSAPGYLILAAACIICSLPLRPARPETTGTVWSTVDGDAQRSRGISTTLVPPLTLKWKSSNYHPIGDENDGIFLIAADSERVYGEVVDHGHAYLEALDASTGRPVWHVPFGTDTDATDGGGVLAGGRLFLLLIYSPTFQQQTEYQMNGDFKDHTNHIVVALDARTGRILWETGTSTLTAMRKAQYLVGFMPLLRSGDELLTLTDSNATSWMGLAAFQINDGHKIWGPLGPPGNLPLLIGKNIVEWNGTSEGIDLEMRRSQDGALDSKLILDDPRSTTYATAATLHDVVDNKFAWADDSVPLVCADRGGVLCFYNLKTNQNLPVIYGSSLGHAGIVYALCRNLRRPTGKSDEVGRPIYAQGNEKTPRLVTFDARTWYEMWSIPENIGPIAITGNILWCTTNGLNDVYMTDLIAVDRKKGKVLWRHQIGAYSQIIAGPKGLYLFVWNQKSDPATSARHLECWAPAGR